MLAASRFLARLRPPIIHLAEIFPWRRDLSALQDSPPQIAMPWPHILRAVDINTHRDDLPRLLLNVAVCPTGSL